MKMVYSNENQFLVNNIKNLIETAGIKTFIKNEFAQGAVGEISAFDAWPEVWVVNDEEADIALNIVKQFENAETKADWICKNCNEQNGTSFEICWNCQQ